MRHLLKQIDAVCKNLDVQIVPCLSRADRTVDGKVRIAISCSNVSQNAEARRLMRSALFCALTDTLDVSDLHVFLPPPVVDDCGAATACVVVSEWTTSWIAVQCEAARAQIAATAHVEFARVYTEMLRRWCYLGTLHAYPWRDADVMVNRLAFLMQRSPVCSSAADVGNVDDLLPPVETILVPFDVDVVVGHADRVLGRKVSSLLELYEVVYRHPNPCLPQTYILRAAVFVCA